MKRRSKTPSRILAALLAFIMTTTSVPVTAFATDLSDPTIQSISTIIDDPVSGETGSGWDNIGGGDGSGSGVTPPEEGEGDNGSSSTSGDGKEDGNSSSPENGDDNSPDPEGGDEDDGSSSKPEEGNEDDNTSSAPDEGEKDENSSAPEEDGPVDADDLNGVDDVKPADPPANGVVNGTELPWASNFKAYAEATMAMPVPFAAGDEGGGSVEFTHYGWGVTGGDGTNAVWMGSEPNGGGYYFADVYRTTYDGADAFCGEFNGQQPGGNYTRGGEGNDEQIKKIIASYEASGKDRGDYIAAQTLIWARLLGTTVTHWGTSGAMDRFGKTVVLQGTVLRCRKRCGCDNIHKNFTVSPICICILLTRPGKHTTMIGIEFSPKIAFGATVNTAPETSLYSA